MIGTTGFDERRGIGWMRRASATGMARGGSLVSGLHTHKATDDVLLDRRFARPVGPLARLAMLRDA